MLNTNKYEDIPPFFVFKKVGNGRDILMNIEKVGNEVELSTVIESPVMDCFPLKSILLSFVIFKIAEIDEVIKLALLLSIFSFSAVNLQFLKLFSNSPSIALFFISIFLSATTVIFVKLKPLHSEIVKSLSVLMFA